MTALLLPSPRLLLRHPAARAVLVLLVLGPAVVAWWGKDSEAPLRLRVLGFLLAAAVALAWDDRSHALTAPTAVGLPAVRRGRLLAIGLLAALAFVLGCLAVPDPADARGAALGLQAAAITGLLLAVAGWFGRDGDSVLTVPFPALLLSLAVLNRLPHQVALLRADPASTAWAAERTRWWLLLALCLPLVVHLQRDPAAPASYRWRAK